MLAITERDFINHLHLPQISNQHLLELASSSAHADANRLHASNVDTMTRQYIMSAVLHPRIPADRGKVHRSVHRHTHMFLATKWK